MLVFRLLKDGKWFNQKLYYKETYVRRAKQYHYYYDLEIERVEVPDWDSLPWEKI